MDYKRVEENEEARSRLQSPNSISMKEKLLSPYRQKLVRTSSSKQQLPTLKLPAKPSHRKSSSNIPFCLSPTALEIKLSPAYLRRRTSVGNTEVNTPLNISPVPTNRHHPESTQAHHLDLQLTERLTRVGSQMSQLDVYSAIFDEVIEKDSEYGFLLRKIKQAYDYAISSGQTSERRSDTLLKDNQTLSSKVMELESEMSKVKDELRAACTVRKDNRRLRAEVEALKRKLVKVPELVRIPVPKLNLGSVVSDCFHDEFMENVEEFSPSWREALHNGR